MEGYIGEIRLFAGTFYPRAWQFCNGALLSIAQYTPLFAIIGTVYGGDGQSTFGLPDFRGRVAVGTGTGPGLPNIPLGQMAGSENVSMTSSQMPMHNHVAVSPSFSLRTSSQNGNLNTGDGAYLAARTNSYAAAATADSNLATVSTNFTSGIAGGSQPFSIVKPVLALNYIICLEGIFPSRN